MLFFCVLRNLIHSYSVQAHYGLKTGLDTPSGMNIISVVYTSRPGTASTSRYIEVYHQDTLISRHTNIEECTESALQYATENLPEGDHTFDFRTPNKTMSVRLLDPATGGQGTGQTDSTPPSAPANGSLSSYTATTVRVNWAYGAEPDIQTGRIYKSTTSSSTGFSLVGSVGYPTAFFIDEAYNPAVQSWYRVTAVDNAGNESNFSVTFTDITAPSAPVAPTPTFIASNRIDLSLPTSAALDHSSYQVWFRPSGGSYTQHGSTSSSTYSVTSLSPSTTYDLYCVDVDVSGNASSAGASVSQATASATSTAPLTIIQAYAGQFTGGNSNWTQAISAVGSGNTLIMASWVLTGFGAPTLITDSAGGTYTLDYTSPDFGGFTTRYYRRAGITDAPTSVTLNYGVPVDAMTSVIEIQGTVTPELTATATQPNGSSITLSGTATTPYTAGLAVGSFGIGRTVSVDGTWTRLGPHPSSPDPNAAYMQYKQAMGSGSVGFTNTWSGGATQGYATMVTYQGDGGVPYIPQGPIPSGWDSLINWPTAPTSGAQVAVTPATFSANLATGANLLLGNGNYGAPFITSSMTDITLTAATPGGAVFNSGLRVDGSRVRINGVRITGNVDLTQGPQDLLFDDVHITHGAGTQPTVYIGNSFVRVAFINSTILNTDDSWPFLYAGGLGVISQDFILANCYTNATTGQANNDALRIGHTSRIIFIDNWIESNATTSNQFRLHNEIEDILLSNNILVDGAAKLFIDIAGDGVGGGYARRFYAIENTMYDQTVHVGSDGPFTAMSNNGSVSSASAVDNNHYAGAQTSGTSTMNQGGTPWTTFTNNIRRVYQAPPTRTQGASH